MKVELVNIIVTMKKRIKMSKVVDLPMLPVAGLAIFFKGGFSFTITDRTAIGYDMETGIASAVLTRYDRQDSSSNEAEYYDELKASYASAGFTIEEK